MYLHAVTSSWYVHAFLSDESLASDSSSKETFLREILKRIRFKISTEFLLEKESAL